MCAFIIFSCKLTNGCHALLTQTLSTQLSSHNTLFAQTPDTILHFKQVTASNIVHNI